MGAERERIRRAVVGMESDPRAEVPPQWRHDRRRQRAHVVQAKLRVGAAHDPLEREADCVATHVLRRLAAVPASTETTVAGFSPDDAAGQPAAGRIRRSAVDAAGAAGHGPEGGVVEPGIARRVQRSSGGGQPLDDEVRARMQNGFGADFSGVRVHTDSSSAELSRSLNARAFTTGSDIFFGAGEYQPASARGQELLAHELTHTLQQSSSRVQRSSVPAGRVSDDRSDRIRRWDMKRGIDLGRATKIRTIDSGQAVFMAQDATGEEIVIKAENYPMALMKLATLVHQSVHDVEIIDSFPIDNSQKQILSNKINDPNVTADESWAAIGKNQFKRYKQDGDSDADAGRRGHQSQIGGLELQAQALARGIDAKKQAVTSDKSLSLRPMLQSPKYMRQIGAAAAADLFTGNADRAGGLAANLGNWVTTADERIKLIDNMDNLAKHSYGTAADDLFTYDMVDWGKDNDLFYEKAIDNILGAAKRAGDDTIVQWATAEGGFIRRFMIEDYRTGFDRTIARIVKLYGSDKGKSAGRALKADVKSLHNGGDSLDYWEVLKARARYMQNPKKGPSLRAQILKRHAAADKKAAKKKK
jgi:hypothetical protein